MKLLQKVWRSLLFRDFSTWSPAHGAMYNQLLGRRKVVGYEWELHDDYVKVDHIPYALKASAGWDGLYLEVRVAFNVQNPKWVMGLFELYESLYAQDVLPTGYHVTYNLGIPHSAKSNYKLAPLSRCIRYERYHADLFGQKSVGIVVGRVKSQPIAQHPHMLQFKPVVGALTPYQVLFDTILRNQMVYGMLSGKSKFDKIEGMAQVMLDATPRRLLPIFVYPPTSILGRLVASKL